MRNLRSLMLFRGALRQTLRMAYYYAWSTILEPQPEDRLLGSIELSLFGIPAVKYQSVVCHLKTGTVFYHCHCVMLITADRCVFRCWHCRACAVADASLHADTGPVLQQQCRDWGTVEESHNSRGEAWREMGDTVTSGTTTRGWGWGGRRRARNVQTQSICPLPQRHKPRDWGSRWTTRSRAYKIWRLGKKG